MDLLKLKKVSIILFFAMFPSVIGAGMMTYQVRVSDAGGNYLDGPVTLGFRIYDSPSGNTVLWGETQDLTADQGIVDADLGKVNPLPEGLFENPELYLGITVQGDPEMAPRKRLVSTWKTISANRASGKRVQAGGCTLTVSGASEASADITFPQEFQSPPVVMLGAPSAARALRCYRREELRSRPGQRRYRHRLCCPLCRA